MIKERAVHPGADDNASGTAALLLSARTLAEQARENLILPRRRLLFVAFAGEELGLLGSAHLTRHLDALHLSAEQVVAMINMDMVGRLRHSRLQTMGVNTARGWRRRLREANRALGLRLDMDGSVVGASDHIHFYHLQVPVLHLFTGSHKDYHRPSDTPDKINAFGGASVTQLVSNLTWRLATDPARLRFVSDNTSDYAPTSHGSARLGIMPDYGTVDAEGCAVAIVMDQSPAEEAGFLAGDLIWRWNNESITGVHDLTAALALASPGDRVVVTVKRNCQTLPLTVTLGSR